jgi:hypothetical protein
MRFNAGGWDARSTGGRANVKMLMVLTTTCIRTAVQVAASFLWCVHMYHRAATHDEVVFCLVVVPTYVLYISIVCAHDPVNVACCYV